MLDQAQREVFAAMADVIIPAWQRMPSASSVGVQGELLDRVLAARPDILEGVRAAIEFCRAKPASEGVNTLSQTNKAAFDAFTLAATGAYYMNEKVRQLIGYPGQESPPYSVKTTPEYLTDGTLEAVARRGAIYRSTPR